MTVDYKERRALELDRQRNPKMGHIWRTHWGYDQTNVEFFEVVAVTAKSVNLRRLQSTVGDDNRLYPLPGRYTRDWSLDGNDERYNEKTGEWEPNPRYTKAEQDGYSETGWRRISGHSIRIDRDGYIRHAFPYLGGGAYETFAAGGMGH